LFVAVYPGVVLAFIPDRRRRNKACTTGGRETANSRSKRGYWAEQNAEDRRDEEQARKTSDRVASENRRLLGQYYTEEGGG